MGRRQREGGYSQANRQIGNTVQRQKSVQSGEQSPVWAPDTGQLVPLRRQPLSSGGCPEDGSVSKLLHVVPIIHPLPGRSRLQVLRVIGWRLSSAPFFQITIFGLVWFGFGDQVLLVTQVVSHLSLPSSWDSRHLPPCTALGQLCYYPLARPALMPALKARQDLHAAGRSHSPGPYPRAAPVGVRAAGCLRVWSLPYTHVHMAWAR